MNPVLVTYTDKNGKYQNRVFDNSQIAKPFVVNGMKKDRVFSQTVRIRDISKAAYEQIIKDGIFQDDKPD